MVQRVLVVGAGPGGLATAILLAQAGLQVQLLERLPRVGGRTSTLEAHGFRFDLGPTFFLYPRILAEIYAAAGYDLHQEMTLVRLDPQYRLVFGAGGELHATSVLERMEQEIARLAPQDAPSLRRFLADNRTKLERFKPCMEAPFSSWRDVCTVRMLRLLPLLRPWRSLDRELRTYFQDPRVRLAFAFQSKYLGMSPFQCPSLFSILSFLEYEYGVYHPLGGCGAVTESMARVAARHGVDIILNEPVTSLLFHGRRAVGARTAHGVYRADAVVLNADFGQAMTTLVPDTLRRRWTDRKIARKRLSCSTFMLYLGLAGSYPHVPHHTIYLSRDYLTNLENIERQHVLFTDPSFYVQNACVTDPTLAPPGMSTLYVLVPVTHQHPHVDWHRERQHYRNLVLRHLAHIGIEDVERRIRFEHIVTPADWEGKYALYRGATFSLAHNLRQMLHLRPHNRFEDLDAVYLVGGGTHPGSGLPVIFESARITARLVLEDGGLALPWLAPAAGQPSPARQHWQRRSNMRPSRPCNNGAGRQPALGVWPDTAATNVREALRLARQAQSAWAAQSLQQRLSIIRRMRHSMARHPERLAQGVTHVAQRTLAETLVAEVLPLVEACRFLEREAPQILALQRLGARGRPLWLHGVELEICREPLGVVLIIAPVNYPLLLPGVQMLQALVAGNAVLLKPGAGGLAAAGVLVQHLERAGLDRRLVQVLSEAPAAAQAAIVAGVDKVLVTGSAATGTAVLATLAPCLTPAVLELSGCDAAFVRADADLELVVRALLFSLRLHGGATCIAPRRIFVARTLAAALEARLVHAVQAMAPCAVPPAVAVLVQELVAEACAQGACHLAGDILPDHTMTPVVVADATPTMRLLQADVFAPVLALVHVHDDDDALAAAAPCPYALGATVFGRDKAARALAQRVRAGVVVVNDAIVPTADPRLPFGGRGQSGFGVTRGAAGLLELTHIKAVAIRHGRWRPHYDPPLAQDTELFRAYIAAAHGASFWERLVASLACLRALGRRLWH